jgi:alpha/beta superfamily hydrolase
MFLLKKQHPHIKRVVGDSFGWSVASELQQNHPEILASTFGTLVRDLMGMFRTTQ